MVCGRWSSKTFYNTPYCSFHFFLFIYLFFFSMVNNHVGEYFFFKYYYGYMHESIFYNIVTLKENEREKYDNKNNVMGSRLVF